MEKQCTNNSKLKGEVDEWKGEMEKVSKMISKSRLEQPYSWRTTLM